MLQNRMSLASPVGYPGVYRVCGIWPLQPRPALARVQNGISEITPANRTLRGYNKSDVQKPARISQHSGHGIRMGQQSS